MLNLKIIIAFATLAYFLYWVYNVIYALYFSPIQNVPGPILFQIFPDAIKYYSMKGTLHFKILELHKKYGKVVKIGRKIISFASDEASREIYSTYAYPKNRFYKGFNIIGESVFSTQNKDFHRQRKKLIAPSFSEKTIQEMEPTVKENINNLVGKLGELANGKKKFDLGLYFHYFTFDVIGELSFGKSFNMLKNGYHPIIEWIKDVFFFTVVVFNLPFMINFPLSSAKKLYEFSYEAVEQSKKNSSKLNVLSSLINAKDPETNEKLSEKAIAEESIVQLIAGTDTTSNSLAWTFYLLTKHKEVYDKLKQELLNEFPTNESISYSKCKSECDYLSAVIYESLRILPVVSVVPLRKVPSGGRVIENYFIPESYFVGVSIMALHNLPEHWVDPDMFKPERWLDVNNKFKSQPNFMPFLIGPRACLGRTLAWMELYLTTAHLVRNYTFKVEDPDKIVESRSFIVTAPKSPFEVMVVEG